jgi:hypothetical protein
MEHKGETPLTPKNKFLQNALVHMLIIYFCMIHFNIIIPSSSWPSKIASFYAFPPKFWVHFLLLSTEVYVVGCYILRGLESDPKTCCPD